MERITIDAALPDKLKSLTAPAELVDAEGHVIAVVQPRLDPALYDVIGPDVSDDELERRSQPGRKVYTTDEVVAALREVVVNPEWDEAAYDALADIWVQVTPAERDLIEAAVKRAEVILRDRPHEQGESRTGNIRVLVVEPLTLYFRAVPGPLRRVLHVRFFRRRKG